MLYFIESFEIQDPKKRFIKIKWSQNINKNPSFENTAYISEGYSYQYGIYDITNILNPIKLNVIPSFGYAHNAWLNNSKTHLITTEETEMQTIKIWNYAN